jgi:hypothetical protein
MRLILELQRNLCDLHEVKKIKTPFFKERNGSIKILFKIIHQGFNPQSASINGINTNGKDLYN